VISPSLDVIRWLAVCALCLAATAATAHRAKQALTTIERNARSGHIEIVHSMHWHDAELGLAAATGNPQLSLTTLESRARLALYVEQRFGLVDAKTSLPLQPELIGAELSGDYVLVYQELAAPLPRALAVRDDLLRDVFPEQVNQVNLLLGGAVRSLTFAGNDTWKTLILDGP
jgi:hypothetical protein